MPRAAQGPDLYPSRRAALLKSIDPSSKSLCLKLSRVAIRFAIYIAIYFWFRVAAVDPHFGHVRGRGRRGRLRFANIRQGYAPDGLGVTFAGLPEHERQCSDALGENELLRLLRRHLDSHGLDHRRVLLPFVGELARRENLDVLQQDVGVGTARF